MICDLVAAWAITRQIVIPLSQTLKVAERVAAGDLTHNLISERQDELGQLQRAMQNMTVGLRELIGGISDGVTQIASAAEELSAVTEQTSAGVNSQKVETDQAMNQQIATAAEQQSAVAEEINRSVLNVRDVCEQTSVASEETAASSAELARLGVYLQTLVGRFRI